MQFHKGESICQSPSCVTKPPTPQRLSDFLQAQAWVWTGHETKFRACVSTTLFQEFHSLINHCPMLSLRAFLAAVAARGKVYASKMHLLLVSKVDLAHSSSTSFSCKPTS
eukprot:scaffold45999_cov37-Prasinocladus_malaysianus.AAC.7